MSGTTLRYLVPGISCSHCVLAIREELERVPGVTHVDVELEGKRVTVHGDGIDDGSVRAAIVEAGYEPA